MNEVTHTASGSSRASSGIRRGAIASIAARWPDMQRVLNTTWHKRALQYFMIVVLAHWGEHLVQAYQIYVLGWAVADSRGIVGQWIPWVVRSESLHYAYALAMLIGLWALRDGFAGRSRRWWYGALGIQLWHHIEHALLLSQAWTGHNLFGAPVPMSIAQFWIPRVELHLLYNSLVFIPMVAALSYHGSSQEAGETNGCSCHATMLPASQN